MNFSKLFFLSTFTTIVSVAYATTSLPVEVDTLLIDDSPVSHELNLMEAKESWEICFPQIQDDKIHPNTVGLYKQVSIEGEYSTIFETTAGNLKPLDQYCTQFFSDAEDKMISLRITLAKNRNLMDRSGDSDQTLHQFDSPKLYYKEISILLPHKYDRNGDGVLGNTVIGIYPDELSESAPSPVQRNKDAYLPPTDFYEITSETEDKFISKYARLGEFAPETVETDSDRMAAIDFELLKFWDAFHDDMKELGYDINGPRILRGYVSPQDRMRMQRLGIELAEFTRFQYGDALAVIYDQNKDYRMDDLNEDGKIDVEDARALSEIIRDTMSENNMYGGVGISSSFEGPNHIGTPYVHIDLRGWNLNWEE